ncbi:hypothetical protein ABT369_44945 [Dactylosporangium sp. NPDC000244]|uniref:hypothetical protein n=1 Tax=Dactylosporangium sp. NPDC000244 TaxID=3154365 RepID=UPI003318A6BF|nr:hypothetical protein GCM10020063_018100 [Dactylosporangium thailandense]
MSEVSAACISCVDTIVAIVRKVTPPEAVRSVLLAEVDDHYTGARMEFHSATGPLDSSGWVAFADPWTDELSDTLLALRAAMVARGSPSRFGLTFTVEGDGGFDVSVTYEMPPDLPWIH